LGKGEHVVDVFIDEHGNDNNTLKISSAMRIVGRPDVPKELIVVVGGIHFQMGIQGNCHLEHLTLSQAKKCGVRGWSSFTMEDVLVEQCGFSGVSAQGTGVVGRCTDVEVHQCGRSGVCAVNGGSITLIGAKTTVHHNCTRGRRTDYGLQVYHSSSTIQFGFPLAKEQVSIDNGGGGNWGAGYQGDINQIKTIPLDNQHEMICERFVSMVRALHPHRASEIAGLVLGTIPYREVLNLMEDLDALKACVNAAVLQVAAKVTKVKNRKNKKNKKNKNNKKKKKKKK
jgi:hypothetical protein